MTEPLRVGIVGCGNVAVGDHIPCYLAHPDLFQIEAVTDPIEERRMVARERAMLGAAATFTTVEEMLASCELDVVDVCTPQRSRPNVAIEALEHGAHVLAEKPLATIPAEAQAIVELAATSDRRVAVMHNYLFLPEIAAALGAVHDGVVGSVEVVIVNMLGVLDNPGNAAYAPRWRHDPAQSGGGVLMDMLHAVYVAEALLGRPGERASAWVSQRSPDTLVEELALCRFETAAAAAVVNVGWGVGPGGIDVSGTHGRLAIRYRGGGTGPFDPLDAVTVTSGEGEVWTVPTGERRFDGVEGILLDFAAAIAERRDPLASGEDGLHVLESVLAAYASARRGLAVSLPLDRDDPLFTNGILGLIREVA